MDSRWVCLPIYNEPVRLEPASECEGQNDVHAERLPFWKYKGMSGVRPEGY